jgi:hypothetical protein
MIPSQQTSYSEETWPGKLRGQELAAGFDSRLSTRKVLEEAIQAEPAEKAASVSIPKRFMEITTWKGKVDREFFTGLNNTYGLGILKSAKRTRRGSPSGKRGTRAAMNIHEN